MKKEDLKDLIILIAIIGGMVLMAIIAWVCSGIDTVSPYY